MIKIAFRFGLIILALLILFQLSSLSLVTHSLSADLIISIGAVILIGLGVYLGLNFKKQQKTTEPAKEVDREKVAALGLSSRELEVLELVARGLSNREVADQLFVSESTVKTHVSNLFIKLDVKRRTQAVTRAKELNLIA